MVYCDRCGRSFSHYGAYDQHRQYSSSHFVCWDCNIDFESWVGLKEHWVQSKRHSYCQYCDRHFDDNSKLSEHFDDEHYLCSGCNIVFKNEHFGSQNSLNNHLNSSIHRPKDVPCPMRGCGQYFISLAAVALHLEAGSCTSGMDRYALDRLIQKYDKNHLITDPSRLISNGDSTTTRYYATEMAYNEYYDDYECYLCDQTFRSLSGLNQHLGSAKHQQEVYICRFTSCGLRFRALSALCQHIESGKCGALRGTPYKSVMGGLMDGMKRLTV
ncbi:hypothetical protein PC9H_002977 [Pleurotus ostreatus]|uniref:C2H2-type domain-containing protein n=1 Tax=Pleurotus ostreatus TaxID=5322 RepID=A0A8H7A1H0_PLEOS|nr:uncharacterized protein PC9H_002977 [Pleurotus ostreatus]KAF7436151.1 hypothetical protein PC9H_002977 [Pleurotus ostreatus]